MKKVCQASEEIEQLFSELESKREALLRKLQTYNYEQLNTPINEKGWSVMQCIGHIRVAEHKIMGQINEAVKNTSSLRTKSVFTSIRERILIWALKSPAKFEAPLGFRTEDFPIEDTLEQCFKEWWSQRIFMKKSLMDMDTIHFQKEVHQHPSIGGITITGTMLFFKAHFNRHLKQINRILQDQQV